MSLCVKSYKGNNLSEKSIIIPAQILNKYNVKNSNRKKLQFGQLNTIASVYSNDNNFIYISEALSQCLHIPEDAMINIAYRNNTIFLGPILGIFVNPNYINQIKRQNPPVTCIQMRKANKNSDVLIYYFTIYSINWMKKIVTGWYYSYAGKCWKKDRFPLPDVLYDKGVDFTNKEALLVNHIRKQFSCNSNIVRINSTDCLDKYYLYNRLIKHNEIKKFLPETIKYISLENIMEMLRKYSTVFLKSYFGSRASGVLGIISEPGNTLRCQYFNTEHNLITHTIKSKYELELLINDFFNGRKFVIQQGIEILRHENKLIDMRVLIQKCSTGRWKIVYNAVAVGTNSSCINSGSNTGVKFYDFNEIMPVILDVNPETVLIYSNKLEEACLLIARAIENEYGQFGEIGMDMCLDKDLNIWYLEANSKPDRALETNDAGMRRLFLCCKNTISYTKYLSGFNDY